MHLKWRVMEELLERFRAQAVEFFGSEEALAAGKISTDRFKGKRVRTF